MPHSTAFLDDDFQYTEKQNAQRVRRSSSGQGVGQSVYLFGISCMLLSLGALIFLLRYTSDSSPTEVDFRPSPSALPSAHINLPRRAKVRIPAKASHRSATTEIFHNTFDLATNTDPWFDATGKEIDLSKTSPVTITPESTHGNFIYLKRAYWGRKIFYVEATLPEATDEGAVLLLNNRYFDVSNVLMNWKDYPSAGEIGIFESRLRDRSAVYPHLQHQCAAAHNNKFFDKKHGFSRQELRFAVVVDNLPPGDEGQFIQLIPNPPREFFHQTSLNVTELLSHPSVKLKPLRMINNKTTFWGSKNIGQSASCRRDLDLGEAPTSERATCGWPFFEGFAWSAQCPSGKQLLINAMKVYQPHTRDNICLE